MGATYPTDTIPLANALQDIQDALEAGGDRDDMLVRVLDVMQQPDLQARLERICAERREKKRKKK